MNPGYLLAKLTPKTTNYQARVTGGKPADLLSEAAGALAGTSKAAPTGLSKGPYYLALYAWTGDDSARYELELYLWDALVSRGTSKGWKVKSGEEQLRKLARVTINSEIKPPKCIKCAGRGEIFCRGVVRSCTRCGGGGNEPIKNSHICRIVGVDRSRYNRTWCARHNYAVNVLRAWDSHAYHHVLARQGQQNTL